MYTAFVGMTKECPVSFVTETSRYPCAISSAVTVGSASPTPSKCRSDGRTALGLSAILRSDGWDMSGLCPAVKPPGPGILAGGSFVPPPLPGFCASTVATTAIATSRVCTKRGRALSCPHAALSDLLIVIAASMP